MISHVMTLANGIIGVSVLAMPFCFKQCGIVLATLMLLLSSILSRLACHFLIKSAVMSRRRNFEFLAFHAFGPMGKIFVELCIIGFLFGTCIAYFVVVGDLGPQIIGEMINRSPGNIRNSFLITTGIFIVLPLGLLRNIDSLASVSTASIAFYICLVLKVIAESTDHIFDTDWVDKVHYWRIGGILQCLPIFALALFCQTQLFEIYETMPNATLEKMNQVVRGALNICTTVYVCVGLFGYIAFCTQSFTGNILMSFERSLTSEIIKIGFVLSVAFSFPLVIFPCRASLNSLLFRRGYSHETSTSYITETRFRCLTTFIVAVALVVGILIPNIEFVLGIVGSTIGVIICLIFPAMFFISISTKNTNERLIAQVIVFIGMWIMILGTYANLFAVDLAVNSKTTATTLKLPSQMNNVPHALVNNDDVRLNELKQFKHNVERALPKPPDKADNGNVRQEPPIPMERIPESENSKDKPKVLIPESVTISAKIVNNIKNVNNEPIKDTKIEHENAVKKSIKNEETNDSLLKPKVIQISGKENENVISAQKNDVIEVDAIKKEESELAADKEISNADPVQRREQLEKTLEKHIMQQQEMMQEQIELLKDIEQKEKELAKKIETKPVIDKNNIGKANVENNGLKNEKPPEKSNQQKLENENIKQEIKIQSPPLDNDRNPIISVKLKNSLNNEVAEHNENAIEQNEKQVVDKKVENIENSKIVEKPNANSNMTEKTGEIINKKYENPIIKALTKQSIKIVNGNQASDIQKGNNKSEINSENNKANDQKNIKNIEYSIPIVLKMNNQTIQIADSENVQINKSNFDASPAGRDILEHQREKRMIEEDIQALLVETDSNRTVDDQKINAVVENAHVDKSTVDKNIVIGDKNEVCDKNDKETQNEQVKNKVEHADLSNEQNPEYLIKTSAYLSDQDVIRKVSIDPDLNANDALVKLKKRDLKALKFDGSNEK